jgi:hypothetical protein
VQFYKQHLLDTLLSPEPVPARWGTWIEAVIFYSEHFETVKSIVAKFPSESAVSVHESQNAFSNQKLACPIAYIRSNFGWLLKSIKRLETKGLPLQESMDVMKIASEKRNAVKWESGESVSHQVAGGVKNKPWIVDIYQCLMSGA